MKLVDIGFAAALFAGAVVPAAGTAAGTTYSDTLCPEATPRVIAVQGLTTAADPPRS